MAYSTDSTVRFCTEGKVCTDCICYRCIYTTWMYKAFDFLIPIRTTAVLPRKKIRSITNTKATSRHARKEAMETATLLTRAGLKRRRTAAVTSMHSSREPRHQAFRKQLLHQHTQHQKSLTVSNSPNDHHPENFLGSSPANDHSPPTTRAPLPPPRHRQSRAHRASRQPETERRRQRRKRPRSISPAALHWWRLAVTLGCLSTSLSFVAAAASGEATANTSDGPQAAATAGRFCAPAESARAYVTTLAGEARGQVLGPRVLAQSLRSSGAKGDIVVLVPLDRATGANVDSLRRDGLTVHIVPRGLQTGGLLLRHVVCSQPYVRYMVNQT